MTFDSSNRATNETATVKELETMIRTAMGEGCITPSHVFDAVDEVLDRLNKQQELLERSHEYMRRIVNSEYFRSDEARGIADDLWDAIHKGDEEWKKIHLDGKGN